MLTSYIGIKRTFIQRREGQVMVKELPVGHVKDREEKRFPVWPDAVNRCADSAGAGKWLPVLGTAEARHSCSVEDTTVYEIFISYYDTVS